MWDELKKAKAWSTSKKMLAFILLTIILFVLGLFIGYGVIGDGSFLEVLDYHTWTHIIDFTK